MKACFERCDEDLSKFWLTLAFSVLTWVSIYWFSRAGPTASLRIYYEVERSGGWQATYHRLPSAVLVGISLFPKELIIFPKTWSQTLGNVVFIKKHNAGGHFAAYEKPNELVTDLREMFGKKGPGYKVVKGYTGYDASRVHAKL